MIGAKPTSGIRFVDGTDQLRFQVGGGVTPVAAPFPTSTTDPNYLAGATGTLFRRLTGPGPSYAPGPSFAPPTTGGGFTINFQTGAVSHNPTYVLDYSVRGYANPSNPYIFDASPRLVSNLVADQTGKTPLQVLDDPYALEWTQAGSQAGKRVSLRNNTRHETILTGSNPLPNSGIFALFGQYNDHGLDFLDKGKDGTLLIPLLPGDSLYTPGAPTNFMALSRTNTVQVEIGEGSKDALLTELGLASYVRPSQWDVDNENAAIGTIFGSPSGGTLVLNDQLITINPGASLAQVVDAINSKTAFTGVVVSTTVSNGSSVLKLTPRNGESVNNTSAPVPTLVASDFLLV